jgi:hypothetical protein
MKMPKTEVDARFSDPATAGTSWDDARQVLEMSELFWITTVRADGRPHITPLVAVWLDDALHFCTGGAEQKAVNLRGNRNVILMTGCNRWDRGLDVVLEGEAIPSQSAGVRERRLQPHPARFLSALPSRPQATRPSQLRPRCDLDYRGGFSALFAEKPPQ